MVAVAANVDIVVVAAVVAVMDGEECLDESNRVIFIFTHCESIKI